MMHKHYLTLTLCSLALALASGCSSPGLGGSDYTSTEVRGEQSVRLGTVESVRKVHIQSSEPGILGALGGGVAGAALGSTIGGGNGNAAATVLGALAAGAAGNAAQNALSRLNPVWCWCRLVTPLPPRNRRNFLPRYGAAARHARVPRLRRVNP